MALRKIIASDDAGTPGPAGPPGPPGASGTTYVHTQAIPDSVWTIPHNLGKNPSVAVVDSAHSLLEADVDYTDLNNLTITFSGGCSGTATCN